MPAPTSSPPRAPCRGRRGGRGGPESHSPTKARNERQWLIANVDLFARSPAAHDVETPRRPCPRWHVCPGPIVPAIVADEQTLIEVWNRLFDQGIFSGISVFPGVRIGNPCGSASPPITHRRPRIRRQVDSFPRPAESIRRTRFDTLTTPIRERTRWESISVQRQLSAPPAAVYRSSPTRSRGLTGSRSTIASSRNRR